MALFHDNISDTITPSSGSIVLNGSVGIGTSTPNVALDVRRSTGEAVVGITNSGTGSAWVTLSPGSSGGAYFHNVGATNPTIFTTNGTERVRIDSSGNFLIGQTTAVSKLTVAGTVYAAPVANPQNSGGGAQSLGFYTNGSYGGGIGFLDGSNSLGIYSTAGNFNFATGSGSTGALTTQMLVGSNGNLQFNSGYGSYATAYGCRAWCQYSGSGISGSANISSVTKNGTGDYTFNYSSGMPDAVYSVPLASATGSTGPSQCVAHIASYASGSVRVQINYTVNNSGNSLYDAAVSMAVFR